MQTMVTSAVKERLRRLWRSPHHAYLFEGPVGTGKREAAAWFAGLLQCEQPAEGESCEACEGCRVGSRLDLFVLSDDGKKVGIDEIRALQSTLALTRTARHRVAVIEEARRLTPEAEASLLKTLEEPATGVVVVLTDSTGELAETITSRTHRIRFSIVSESESRMLFEEIGIREAAADELIQFSPGRPALAARTAGRPEALQERREAWATAARLSELSITASFELAEGLVEQESLGEYLLVWIDYFRDRLHRDEEGRVELVATIEAIERTREALRRHTNPRLTLEVLMIEIHRIWGAQ